MGGYNNGTYQDGKVKLTINSLGVGNSIELTYTVKVKNDITNVSNVISSTGKFYAPNNSSVGISTGTVENKIVAKAFNTTKTYQTCYKENQSKTGRELIDAIYKCATNKDFQFDEFEFENIFIKEEGKPKGGTHVLYIKDKLTETNTQFVKMMLNNYYGGLASHGGSASDDDVISNAVGDNDEYEGDLVAELDESDGTIIKYSVNLFI